MGKRGPKKGVKYDTVRNKIRTEVANVYWDFLARDNKDNKPRSIQLMEMAWQQGKEEGKWNLFMYLTDQVIGKAEMNANIKGEISINDVRNTITGYLEGEEVDQPVLQDPEQEG